MNIPDSLLLLAGVALLAFALLGLRALVDIVPVTRARRETLRRALPIVTVVVVLLAAIAMVRLLFPEQPRFAAVGSVGVLVAFVAASFAPLRDVVSGVFITAGRLCREGDHVRIGDLQGRITAMGVRVLVLETTEGTEAIIPYSRVTRDQLLRTSAVDAVSPHVFRTRMPAVDSLAAVKQRIRRRALLCHWSAVGRLPEVAVVDDSLEVTVYAIDPDRGADIEAEIRRDLATDSPVVADASPAATPKTTSTKKPQSVSR